MSGGPGWTVCRSGLFLSNDRRGRRSHTCFGGCPAPIGCPASLPCRSPFAASTLAVTHNRRGKRWGTTGPEAALGGRQNLQNPNVWDRRPRRSIPLRSTTETTSVGPAPPPVSSPEINNRKHKCGTGAPAGLLPGITGPLFQFNESISFIVQCDTQDEIDLYREKPPPEGGCPGPRTTEAIARTHRQDCRIPYLRKPLDTGLFPARRRKEPARSSSRWLGKRPTGGV